MREAEALPHPFEDNGELELDAEFAAEGVARLGPAAAGWRSRIAKSLRKLATALRPLDQWALAHRPTTHVDGWSPALTAAFVSLLDWPDRELPWCLVQGFQVVGRIPPSGVHKQVDADDTTHEELISLLLGESAAEFVDELEADTRVHEHAQRILEVTQEEIDLGLSRPLETRASL